MNQGPWDAASFAAANAHLSDLNARLLKLEDTQRDILFELKELNKSQTNTAKTISNIGVPLWVLAFLGLATFWKLGWAGEFWYSVSSFFQ